MLIYRHTTMRNWLAMVVIVLESTSELQYVSQINSLNTKVAITSIANAMHSKSIDWFPYDGTFRV